MPLDSLTQTFPQKGKKKTTSKEKDKIVLNPEYDDKKEVTETKESTAVMAFGRFNPPTVGHEKLIHKVHEVAKEHDGSAHVVASHSEGTSKDPLPQSKKLDYLKKVAPTGVHVSGSSKESPSFLHAAKKLHDAGHKHLVMVAGSDRVDEYKKKLDQYNGKEGHFNFKSIKVVSSGERDPDAEGVQGMSGTKMRAHARAGEHEQFKAGLPKALHPHAKEIADHIRSVKEDTDYLEERVVTLQQRRRRSLQMKRLQSKLRTARKISRLKMAGQTQLTRRAYRAAKQMLRRRFVGPVAVQYQDVSPSDKVMMDRRVDDKIKIMKSLVKRIMPRIRQAESSRLQAARQHKKTNFVLSKAPIVSSVTYDEFNKLSDLVEATDNSAKTLNALFNKSFKSGVPFNVIAEVYRRGVDEWQDEEKTAEQLGFERVNSFINGGKALEIDYDLVNENLRQWFQDKWVRMDTKGNIKGQCAREPGEGKPKCLPLAKARAMDKEDRATAVQRKRREDPNPERSGAAINVRTEEKDACYHKVKARYKVWPSAYASGALSKCRKKGAANWGNASEETQIDEISKDTKMRYIAKAAASTNEPKEGEKQSDYLERLHKRMSGIKKALSSTNPSQRFQKEEHGAGDEGTDKLVKKYKNDTPCQENFMDGKNPEDKGDMSRHGLKGKSILQLKKVRSSDSASPRAKQLAHWYINMHKGKK